MITVIRLELNDDQRRAITSIRERKTTRRLAKREEVNEFVLELVKAALTPEKPVVDNQPTTPTTYQPRERTPEEDRIATRLRGEGYSEERIASYLRGWSALDRMRNAKTKGLVAS